jgi:hypothetical protein
MSMIIDGSGKIEPVNNFLGSFIELGSDTVIDVSFGRYFHKTLTSSQTLTLYGAPNNLVTSVFVQISNTSNYDIIWTDNISWAGGNAPRPRDGSVFEFVTRDGGSNWFGKLSSTTKLNGQYWYMTYGPAFQGSYAYEVSVDSEQNIYFVGEQYVLLNQSPLLVKLHKTGEVLWQRTLSGYGLFDGVGNDSLGNVYVGGWTSTSGFVDFLIAKYNTNGTLQWQRTLGKLYSTSNGLGVVLDSFGNIYVTGATTGIGAGDYDMLIVKYNTSGTLQWQRTLGGTGGNYGEGITVDSSSNLYVTGYFRSWFTDGCILSKLPSDGSITGVFGSVSLGVAKLVDEISTLTDQTSTLTSATSTLTDQTSSLTSNVIDLASKTIPLG